MGLHAYYDVSHRSKRYGTARKYCSSSELGYAPSYFMVPRISPEGLSHLPTHCDRSQQNSITCRRGNCGHSNMEWGMPVGRSNAGSTHRCRPWTWMFRWLESQGFVALVRMPVVWHPNLVGRDSDAKVWMVRFRGSDCSREVTGCLASRSCCARLGLEGWDGRAPINIPKSNFHS